MAISQDDWRTERLLENRCVKCGSANVWPADYGWDGQEEHPIGQDCRDCGYWTDYSKENSEIPFIAPGEPGSHDKPEDYPDAGTD